MKKYGKLDYKIKNMQKNIVIKTNIKFENINFS